MSDPSLHRPEAEALVDGMSTKDPWGNHHSAEPAHRERVIELVALGLSVEGRRPRVVFGPFDDQADPA